MARTRNHVLNAETTVQIKQAARQLMAQHGTAGLSIRGIAKVLSVSPPALYHYFANLDDLITTLIADSFNSLADRLDEVGLKSRTKTKAGRLLAVLEAYRSWAFEHPIDFQLIYGNPIPGYNAPREITVPAVVRTFVTPVRLADLAIKAGESSLNEFVMTEACAERMTAMITQNNYPVSLESMYVVMTLWTQIHGLIMLDLYGHLSSNVGNAEEFYRHRVTEMLHSFGFHDLT
ncbi:TetR/AcrR family transcriptional regulator [Herpetosiphon llansteffanensis]|uniref:TetR/AcrR family transcriptional regulator n=1 Tax=Herpetosiphon llansteffanensis TaxID=2094568 RepID=UPI000D7BFCA3|nr:TetR/AcrR family transcriptional regulator [Herpetosiphon llansteffanensis]